MSELAIGGGSIGDTIDALAIAVAGGGVPPQRGAFYATRIAGMIAHVGEPVRFQKNRTEGTTPTFKAVVRPLRVNDERGQMESETLDIIVSPILLSSAGYKELPARYDLFVRDPAGENLAYTVVDEPAVLRIGSTVVIWRAPIRAGA